jgi:hypothetical protein
MKRFLSTLAAVAVLSVVPPVLALILGAWFKVLARAFVFGWNAL